MIRCFKKKLCVFIADAWRHLRPVTLVLVFLLGCATDHDTHNLTENVDFCSTGSLRRSAPLDDGNFIFSRHSEARRAVGIQKKEKLLDKEFVLRHEISMRYKDKNFTSEGVLISKKKSLTLIAMGPVGRIFELHIDENGKKDVKTSIEEFRKYYLYMIDDLRLIYSDAPDIELKPTNKIIDAEKSRMLYDDNVLICKITYSGNDRINSDIVLENLKFGYTFSLKVL